MKTIFDFENDIDIAWCPGCGNHQILRSVKEVFAELALPPDRLVMVSGIGQAAKTPQYLRVNFFNGLHGRSLPAATAIKASNPGLTVVCESGDGCTYGEGGNHFIHTIRRNPGIVNIVHDNMIYGLTKGQASPTSRKGLVTPVQTGGVANEPFNPIAVAVALNASFVARAYSGDVERTKSILKAALGHKGYALIDLLHPCVSFNKVNNAAWYKANTYYLDERYNPSDRDAAMRTALAEGPLALGVIYTAGDRPAFEETLAAYQRESRPLYERVPDRERIRTLLETFR
jgi:2-oxoglutarate/2-oxoacid ferredoxin oxidoreductase subunit beta